MDTLISIVSSVLFNFLTVLLFFIINDVRFTFINLFKSIVLRFIISAILAITVSVTNIESLLYIHEPIYGILLSYVLIESKSKKLLLFYGLFPSTLQNLFLRSLAFFILPLFGQDGNQVINDEIYIIFEIITFCLVLSFIRWLSYDFNELRRIGMKKEEDRIIVVIDIFMILYLCVMQVLSYMEYENSVSTFNVRRFILVLYLIFFMGMIKRLDTHLKYKLQAELYFQQELHLNNLEKYSFHIEELYRKVRGFRHDYTNLLTTLKMGIEAGDLAQVEEVYHSVLKDTEERMRDSHFDFGRLVNIQEPALKSLLAAKFSEASDKGLEMHLEIPAPIQPKGMKLVDLITAVSVLVDNAIDESVSEISIAFFEKENSQVLIVENSIEEEAKDLKSIFDFGYSTKGEDRGIGLYNVQKILESYPNVTLETNSRNHIFTQKIIIN